MLPTPENATYSGPVLSEEDKRVGEAVSVQEARQAELDEVIRMSTNIEQLIQELCPDGVPYVAIGEFAEVQRGSGMPKTILTEEGIGAIHYGQIYTLYGTYAESTFTFVSEENAQKLVHVNPGDLIITNTSENLEDVGKSLAWVGDKKIVIGGHVCVIRHKHNSKYLAYWMQTEDFQQQKRRLCTGTKVIELSAKKLTQILVPLPPVEVQEEIVRILDLFTELEAELEAELEKRRLQYAHYRDCLFGETGKQHRVKALGDIVEMKAGSFVKAALVSKDSTDTHPIPCYGAGGLRGYVAEANGGGSFVLIGRQGALCGNVVRGKGPFYATEHAVLVTPKQPLDLSWIYHLLTWMNLNQYATKSAQPGLSVGSLKRLCVSVPPRQRQEEIASVLDQMDALVNDLSSGLPAEIAARRKQYEHYRDRLLSFPELKEDQPAGSTEGALPNKKEPERA